MSLLKAADFKENAHAALLDENLQGALRNVETGFVEKRAKSSEKLPEFEALRDAARDIKDHTLAHLDIYLETYERAVIAAGGHVHFALTSDEACIKIIEICRSVDAKIVTKGKSMVSEEIGLNAALEAAGIAPIETDLGEYIIQLRGETPSHIIAPAIHLNKAQVEADFRKAHTHLPVDRALPDARSLLGEARTMLRQKYFQADVGITGANFLVAETGSSVIVTNEGNGDLTQILPKVHIVVTSLEKLVPTLEDLSVMLRVLTRSATGQEATVYTTLTSGAAKQKELDAIGAYHVVIVDNGRSNMVGTAFQEMLRCIRCGACMNHCPVYHAVGGHAYGAVYPGPMGAVLTPSLLGIEGTGNLPNASTFCGRCESVCPVRIPLPKLMRHWREHEFQQHLSPATTRYGIKIWGWLAQHPKLYRFVTGLTIWGMGKIGKTRGYFSMLPLATGWTRYRDFPTPQGNTFFAQYKRKR